MPLWHKKPHFDCKTGSKTQFFNQKRINRVK